MGDLYIVPKVTGHNFNRFVSGSYKLQDYSSIRAIMRSYMGDLDAVPKVTSLVVSVCMAILTTKSAEHGLLSCLNRCPSVTKWNVHISLQIELFRPSKMEKKKTEEIPLKTF